MVKFLIHFKLLTGVKGDNALKKKGSAVIITQQFFA
jgi:hypothetical protein